MLIISEVLANSTYVGLHPITGKEINQKWSDFTQAELKAIYEMHPSNRFSFDPNSTFDDETVSKQKQAENVNTTAPSTRTANDTVTTTAKGTLS
jgi:hypothetical protein